MDLQLAQTALKKYFGYDSFRPLQEEIIASVFDKKDTLVLMPTGGGKSICYQIPAIALPGTAVVVSPLISLMKDQVEGLRANGVKTAFLNSSLSLPEQKAVENDFFNGALQLLYVSPEKLVSQGFLPLLQRANVNLFAIDEAHCISAWGHDFRPEYTRMKFIKQTFPDIPIIALTATADKLTRKDIVEQLGLEQPEQFIASFDRPNISLDVRPGQKRFEQILSFIRSRPDDSGIIYCLSRKSTEKLASQLQDKGITAAAYHAGLNPAARSQVQEDFINDTTPIVCATVAFGMGIDKSNVRWIIHYNLPKNLESYYQEIGRAGRDGVKADTILFYSFADVNLLRDIITGNGGEQDELKLAKLERMQQFAESMACRRRILLNYFGENMEENCGNCDICKNPPRYFDGTQLTQKALSAIYRLREKVNMTTLIDVLRGSGRKEIIEKGYNKIKTYGAGRDMTTFDWQHYLLQLLNLGFIEIAYDQRNRVRLTAASKEVLFEGKKVELVHVSKLKERVDNLKKQAKQRSKTVMAQDDLFQTLRKLRREIAQQFGVPPYQVFNDATLLAMADKKPLNDEELLRIPGVGERKLQRYGDYFLDALLEYTNKNTRSEKGSTFILTEELLKKGMSIEEIAQKRALNPITIFSHVAYLYEKDSPAVDLNKFIPQQEVEEIITCLKYIEKPVKLKAMHEYFDGRFDYDKLRLSMAYYNKNLRKTEETN